MHLFTRIYIHLIWNLPLGYRPSRKAEKRKFKFIQVVFCLNVRRLKDVIVKL